MICAYCSSRLLANATTCSQCGAPWLKPRPSVYDTPARARFNTAPGAINTLPHDETLWENPWLLYAASITFPTGPDHD